VFSVLASTAGIVEIDGQSPGLFRIQVGDDEGNRYGGATVEVEPGDSGLVAVPLAIVLVRGELRLGAEPLAGTLAFGGANGSQRARLTADEEGAFSGVLPRDGEWVVEIQAEEPPLDTTRRVDVVVGSDGAADLLVELEDTELVGRVVSAEGLAIPDAQVKVDVFSEVVSLRARSDVAGEFRFRGLPAGRAMVTAVATIGERRATSSATAVTLEEDVVAGPVELVVRPMHVFDGQITSASGPVPGARIHVTTLDHAVPSWSTAVSDFEGRFTFELTAKEGLAAFTILPPGGYLSTTVERLQSPLALHAESAGGTVQLTLPAADDPVVLQRDGVYVDPGVLAQWVRDQGHPLAGPGEASILPRLGAGVYRVCTVAEPERRRRLQDGDNWQEIFDGAARCATGSLAPGGTLELSLAAEGVTADRVE
jgi:hypothetical protein